MVNRFITAEPSRCIGCNTCMAGCSTVHLAHGLQGHPRLTVMRLPEATAPVTCHQCEDAPCAHVCPVVAITIEEDEIKLNESRCIGCKMCAIACPFGAITPSGTPVPDANLSAYASLTPATLDPLLAWEAGVRTVAVKCDLCSFSEHGPECVRVCPTNALHLMDDSSLDSVEDEKHRETVQPLHLGTGPAQR